MQKLCLQQYVLRTVLFYCEILFYRFETQHFAEASSIAFFLLFFSLFFVLRLLGESIFKIYVQH